MRTFRGVAIGGPMAGQQLEAGRTQQSGYSWAPGVRINGRDADDGFWMPDGKTLSWAIGEILRVYMMTRGGRA